MIAFRPGKLEGVMEVTAYTNDKRGGWKTTDSPVKVLAEQVFTASCNLEGQKAKYAIGYFSQVTLYTHSWDAHWLKIYREVGTYINSPGAVQEMELEINFKLIN